jgi:hypothetical protein
VKSRSGGRLVSHRSFRLDAVKEVALAGMIGEAARFDDTGRCLEPFTAPSARTWFTAALQPLRPPAESPPQVAR